MIKRIKNIKKFKEKDALNKLISLLIKKGIITKEEIKNG